MELGPPPQRMPKADLGEAVAKALASFFVVAEASVVDVYGRAGSASVGLGEGLAWELAGGRACEVSIGGGRPGWD